MPNTQNKLNSQSTLCLSCPQPCLRKYNLEGTTWYQEKSSLHNILFFLNTSNCSCNENKRKQNKRKQKIPSKISCVQLPSCVKNKQTKSGLDAVIISCVSYNLFWLLFFSFQQWSLSPGQKACTLNDLLGLSISLCLVLYVDQLSVFVLIIIYYKKKFL